MDIDLLSKMIKELILDKDRVVLPGLGCFVAEVVPATFSDKGYTINPPYRRLSFRSKPDIGDELIDFYVEANDLDREVACRILGDFIGELRQVIYTKKVVVLPGLGRLRATKENNLFFIPDEDLDIYPEGVGLEPISLKSHVETPQEVAAAISGLKSMMEVPLADAKDDREGSPESSLGKRIVVAISIVLATVAVLFGAYVGLSRLNPEIFDKILYTPEELEILNYK